MTYSELPAGYSLNKSINLRKDRVYAPLCAFLNVVFFAFSILITGRFIPFTVLFEKVNDEYILTVPRLLLDIVWVFAGLLLYALSHLALKGLFLKALGHQNPKFGIKGVYYYVGSHAYFSRRCYAALVLLPELIMEAILIVICLLVPPAHVWPVAFVQAFHFSRLSTMLLLVILVMREPKTSLFRNMGTLSAVFTK